jgi:proton-translocating NADH-quinone oxidoreductase chain M
MFLIIGVWGSRERKILASYYFFIYTLVGSLVMLIGVIYIFSQIGSTDYETLVVCPFSKFEQKFLWLAFFLSFASKVPMMPFHLWLPEAHVEAPTPGSVILAGVLLKLGSYGFIRFSLPLFPKASYFFAPLIYTIVAMGVIFASFTAIRQTDFKRIIAYTSIAHMNLVILGVFSFNVIGLEGAVFQSLSHGFVASALFLVIGVVYERYGTRIVKYYGGLATVMPIYISIFLFFTIANIGFPGTSSFVGELFIFIGSFKINKEITCLTATSMIIGGGYSLWLFNRISYGNLKIQFINKFLDLSYREVFVFIPLLLGTIISGIYPNIFLISIHMSVYNLIELLYF